MNNFIITIAQYNFINIKKRMDLIKGKYKTTEIIKSKSGKMVERVNPIAGTKSLVLKSYPTEDAKSIQNELEVYQAIKQPHLHGFPQIKEGFQFQGRLYLVFEELGLNIEQLRLMCGGRFSLKTTLMLGLQMLERVEYLHSNGFLHGDIKPSNFLMGKTAKLKHKLYLVDFELSESFNVKGSHIDEKHIENFSGSLRFCAIGPNSEKNLCRRDQLISWLYCLVFFLKGELPWMAVKANNMLEAYNLIASIKKEKKVELFQGLPQTFCKIYENLLCLGFKEKPNYAYLRQEILGLMKKNGYELDYKYDWQYL